MVPSILKFNNLINSNKLKTTPLFSSNLPSPLESVVHNTLYKDSLYYKNNIFIEALNPHNVPQDEINQKVIDVYYTFIKNKNIKNNSNLDQLFNGNSTGIFKINLDEKKSIFFNDGIYHNKYIQEYISVLDNHFCKVTRLNNGKIKLSHLTHHPTDMNKFTFLSNTDLTNQQKAQFISNISFELDENIISGIFPIQNLNNNYNKSLCDLVVGSDHSINAVSEECLFHFSNNKQYDFTFYKEVENELFINSDLAIEILSPLLNK
jgi:hypothetical protein